MHPVDLTTQQYICYDRILTLEEMADCGVTVLSHPTWRLDAAANRQYLEKAHSLGIKVLPYVSPEKAWQLDTDERVREFNSISPATTIEYYKAVDPSSNWYWVLVNSDGQYQPRYGSLVRGEDGAWRVDWDRYLLHGVWVQRPRPIRHTWYMCSSVQGYRDAVVRGVRAVMNLGYDGMFVDNTYSNRLARCHGPEFGKHEHIDGNNTDQTYATLGQLIYETVKSFGRDKIVILNGGTQDVYTHHRDACMLESYVTGHGPDRWPWERIQSSARKLGPERAYGRAVTALSYPRPGASLVERDDLFYAAACAKVSGFLWVGSSWAHSDTMRLLYRARLTQALRAKLLAKNAVLLLEILNHRLLLPVDPTRKGHQHKLPQLNAHPGHSKRPRRSQSRPN